MLVCKTFKIKLNDISNLILCTCKCDAEDYRFPHGQRSIFGQIRNAKNDRRISSCARNGGGR